MKKFAFLLLWVGSLVGAQELKIRQATGTDFVGYWRIQLVPNDVHHSTIKNEQTGYTDPCQFFLHRKDGSWFNISLSKGGTPEEARQRCANIKKSEIDDMAFLMGDAQNQWIKVPNKDGYFVIREKKVTANSRMLLWKADYVLVDVPEAIQKGYEFRKGNLVMQLTKVMSDETVVPIWPMVLQPVLD